MGLKYCKIWSSCSIPTSQEEKHPGQNRSYIISAPQSAPWGISKKHKHSYKGTENACNTDASAELREFLPQRNKWPDAMFTVAEARCKAWGGCPARSAWSPGDREPSTIQTAGIGLLTVFANSWSTTGSTRTPRVHRTQESWGQARCHLHTALSASPPRGNHNLDWSHSTRSRNWLTWSLCATHGARGFQGGLVHTLVGRCPYLIPYTRVLHSQPESNTQWNKW